MIKENQKQLNRLVILLDSLSIFTALMISWYIRFQSGILHVGEEYLPFASYMKPVVFIIPVYLIIYNLFGLYDSFRLRETFHESLSILKANFLGLLIFVLMLFTFKIIDYSRFLLIIFVALSTVITIIERWTIRYLLRNLRKRGFNLKHILIVGVSSLTEELIKKFDENKHWGYNIVGILDDNKKNGYKIVNREVADNIKSIEDYLTKHNIDEVFITLPIKEYEKLGYIINICEKTGVKTQIIPDYYKYIPSRPYVEELEGLPIIGIRHVPLDNIMNRAIKRLFDIVVSLISIAIFSMVMIFIAIIIKLTSPGPIIFVQDRVGLNRKNFKMYKFRSMHVQNQETEKIKWTTENDPRKTKFGSFIRRTSLDELPQIFNVLKGDMSLVGPRPERPLFVQKFKEEIPKYMIKHQVRPGISGWAQVNGWRGNTSIKKRIEYDLYYIENWSFWLDIEILWLTIFKGFVSKNAY